MLYDYKKLRDIGVLPGKKVFLRVDLNVPVENGIPRDTFRIDRAWKTIQFLKERGARTLIVSHTNNEPPTLEPVARFLSHHLPIKFVPTIEEAGRELGRSAPGGFVLLENIRRFRGEVENDQTFARRLASLAQLYINEAFSASHRLHASVVGVPAYLPSYAGFLFDDEVKHLSGVFHPPRPFLFILGGAKFETKLSLVKKFLAIADGVFIGGALSNDFFKLRGYEVGKSKVSADESSLLEIADNPKLFIPSDVLVKSKEAMEVVSPASVRPNDTIVDAGPRTVNELKRWVRKAKYVLWNGPLGAYEDGFFKATEKLAAAIAEGGAESVVGGGDTLAVMANLHLLHRFSFVSTGGGAMLDFLANETLPGIEALGKFSRR